MTTIPPPACPYGYTRPQLESIFATPGLTAFDEWMDGQTMMMCSGSRYNHDTRAYEPDSCSEVGGHGIIVYTDDLERFLACRPVID